LQAKAYGKPLVLVPAVVGAGRFQHHCLVYNAERVPLKVAQLKGRRIGIRAHAQTTVTWVRGVLWDDYGVALNDIQWVTFEDGHLAEFPDPPGFVRAPEGKTMVEMLFAGELDAAIIGTDLPDDPRLQPVLPDPHAAAQAWSVRNKMLPINHMMVVSADLFRQRPDVVRELYGVLEQSKAAARKASLAANPSALDLTPFGVEPNRRALEVLIRNSFDQGLIPRAYAVDELFEEFNSLH
jgi:4,5-dihydroxyphthalate decarboxylase